MKSLFNLLNLLVTVSILAVALLFVLANGFSVEVNLLLPGWTFQLPVGVSLLLAFVLGGAVSALVFMLPSLRRDQHK